MLFLIHGIIFHDEVGHWLGNPDKKAKICVIYILPEKFSHGQHLSNRHWHTAGMINRHPSTKSNTKLRVVASFGRASLVRIAGSNYELRDAAVGDLTAAKEWVSLFMHAAVICESSIPGGNSRWKSSVAF
jgi:hypothetical protein